MKSRTFYISSINGNDANDGLSANTPFLTLNKINEIEICAGDKILLEKGSEFSGEYLHLKNCGDKNSEIIEIASYGDGDMPIIKADGTGVWYQDYGTVPGGAYPTSDSQHQAA